MLKKILLFLPLLYFHISIFAQYVNTDSLVIVPGQSEPLYIEEIDVREIKMDSEVYTAYPHTGDMLNDFLLPHDNKIISRFGPRRGRMHNGTDIRMATGDTVRAVFYGKVIRASYGYGFGNLIVIQHPKGLTTYYAHLSRYLKKSGEWVKAGEAIGLAGSTGRATGSHLHFEMRENNRPYDPELVYDFEGKNIREDVSSVVSLEELQRKLIPKGYSVNVGVPRYYKVRRGDSLWLISRKFKVSIKRICSLNGIKENATIRIGQPLKMY